MATLKPQIKREWIKRLRSGDYTQGQRYLHKGDKFCCLGILCEMAVEAGVVNKRSRGEDMDFACVYGEKEQPSTLPIEVREWAGWDLSSTVFVSDGQTLASLNDAGANFLAISDVIEREL